MTLRRSDQYPKPQKEKLNKSGWKKQEMQPTGDAVSSKDSCTIKKQNHKNAEELKYVYIEQ